MIQGLPKTHTRTLLTWLHQFFHRGPFRIRIPTSMSHHIYNIHHGIYYPHNIRNLRHCPINHTYFPTPMLTRLTRTRTAKRRSPQSFDHLLIRPLHESQCLLYNGRQHWRALQPILYHRGSLYILMWRMFLPLTRSLSFPLNILIGVVLRLTVDNLCPPTLSLQRDQQHYFQNHDTLR